MTVAAFVIAVLALFVSVVSALYVRRSTHAQEAADRRARTPRLVIQAEDSHDAATLIIYTIRNDGPQDLNSVLLHRPLTEDRVNYPIAPVGRDFGSDQIELGPLRLAEESRFVLSIGSKARLPAFRIRIECRAGHDTWTIAQTLQTPRPGATIY